MSVSKPEDPRTRKTKKAIRNAFAKLLSERDINDITVRDIAALAEINRKTFYRYYGGIYQVVDEIENDIVTSFASVLGELNIKEDLKNPYSIFERLTAIVNTDLDFYGSLLSMRGNVSLVSKIVAMLKEKTREALLRQVDVDEQTLDTVVQFAIAGMLSVYQDWFNSDRRRSIEEIAELISIMSIRGFSGILARERGDA